MAENNNQEVNQAIDELRQFKKSANAKENFRKITEKGLSNQLALVNEYFDKLIIETSEESRTADEFKSDIKELTELQKSFINASKINKPFATLESEKLTNHLTANYLAPIAYALQSALTQANFLKYGFSKDENGHYIVNDPSNPKNLPSLKQFEEFLADFLQPLKDKYKNNNTINKFLDGFQSGILEIFKEKTKKKLPIREPLTMGDTVSILTDKVTKNNMCKKSLNCITKDEKTNTIELRIQNIISKKPEIEIETCIAINSDALDGLLVTPFNALQKGIISAINNIYYYNKVLPNKESCIFTLHEVMNLMYGRPLSSNKRYSDKQKEEVYLAIERLLYSRVILKTVKGPSDLKLYIDGKLITKEELSLPALEVNRRTFWSEKNIALAGYEIKTQPALAELASELKQVTYLPYCWYGIENKNITLTDLTIRDYLLEQISQMYKNKGKRNNVIKFETIYEANGLETPEERAEASNVKNKKECARKYAKRDRDNIYKILDSFKEKKDNGQSLILDYKEISKNGKAEKVEIIINKDYSF